MKQHSQISGAEFEVMQILWEADEPLNIQTVCDRLPSNKWAYKTVGTLLMRMEEKKNIQKSRQKNLCQGYITALSKTLPYPFSKVRI